jgi:DNA-binding HxlR family transcriptional regulator
MRSHGQYRALAKALDVVGDRWALLIVRELEDAGVVRREAAPPPVATTLFHRTRRGEELAPVVHALGRWGAPLMAERARADEFRSHWLAMPLGLYLTDRTPDRAPVTIEVRSGDQPMTIETAGGAVRTRPGAAERPDAVLSGPPELVVAVLTGRLDLAEARARGLQYKGDPKTLRRVQPRAPTAD